MRIVHAVAVVISLTMLGAHFLRAGVPTWAIAPALIISLAMLFFRRPWAGRLIQGVLTLGALEWVRTAILLAGRRAELGEPYGRMLLILGFVAAFTLLSALAFQRRPIARAYGFRSE